MARGIREDERVIVGGDTSRARKELGSLGRSAKGTKGNLDRFGKGVSDLDKRSKGLVGRFNRLATTANAVRASFASALIYGVAKIGQTFTSFDDKLRQAGAAMGATAKQFEHLKNEALKVSQATRFTARETAEALLRLGQAGLSVEESIETLPHAMNLAAAGALDVGRAAEIMTDSMAAMGLATSDSQRVADLLAKAAVSTATDVNQMGTALARAAPSARTLGISIEELVLELSILAKQGVKAELSATRIRALVNAISDPKIAQRLREQGVAVFDSQGAFVGLRNLMEQMNEKMKGLNDQARGDFLDLLQNVRAKEAVTSLAGLSPELIAQIAAELEKANGAAAIQAKIMESGLGGAWRRFVSSLEAFVVHAIGALAPALISVFELFTSFVQALNSAKPVFKALEIAFNSTFGILFKLAKFTFDNAIIVFIKRVAEEMKNLAHWIGEVRTGADAEERKEAISKLARRSNSVAAIEAEIEQLEKERAKTALAEGAQLAPLHTNRMGFRSPASHAGAGFKVLGADAAVVNASDLDAQIARLKKELLTARIRESGVLGEDSPRRLPPFDSYSVSPRAGEEGGGKEVSEEDRERALERFADFSKRLSDQAVKAEVDRLAKIRSIEAIDDAERRLMQQASVEHERARAEANKAYDLALAAAKAEQIEEIERRHKENLANLEIAHNERIAGIQSKAAKEAAKLAEDKIATTQTLLGGVSSLLSVFGQQSDKAFKAWKVVAIAEAIIATYAAVNKALASGLGPPWTYIQAAAALAFGMANVARIKATKRDSSSAASTASASAASAAPVGGVTGATAARIYAGRLDAVPGAARLERFTQGETLEAEREHRELRSIRVMMDAKIEGQPIAVFTANQRVQADNS